MIYAVMNGGEIVGRRTVSDWETYAPHKKAARDEKGDGGPTLRPIVFVGEGSIERVEIERDRVVITRSAPAAAVETIAVAYLKAALAQIDKLTTVNATLTDPVLAALWESGSVIRRDDADMIAVASALSIDLDDVWARARAIRAARSS